MDDEVKKNISKVIQLAEMGVSKSILRWKYKKEGRPVPLDHQLENESRKVAARAHEVLSERGKKVWKELRKVYLNAGRKKERPRE
jgi:hypothetical protein